MELIKPEEVVEMFGNPRFLNVLSAGLSLSACVTTGWATAHAIKVKQNSSSTGLKKIAEMGWRFGVPAGLEVASICCGSHSLSIQEERTIKALEWGTLIYGNWILERRANRKMLESEFGPKKVENLEAKKTEEMAAMLGPVDRSRIVNTGEGSLLFYDVISKTYFWSSYEAIATHLANLDRKLHSDPFWSWVTINEYLYEIGLEGIAFGDNYGFTCALTNKFPMGNPSADWAWLDGRRVTCGFLQFTDDPVHEDVKDRWRS